MTWDCAVEKFHWLSEAFADKDLRRIDSISKRRTK